MADLSMKQEKMRQSTIDAKARNAKRVSRHAWLIEEFLETSVRWTFEPKSPPYENQALAEARIRELRNEFPWAKFRAVHAITEVHIAAGWRKGGRKGEVCLDQPSGGISHGKATDEHE